MSSICFTDFIKYIGGLGYLMTDLILVIAAKLIIEKRTNIFLTIGSVDYFDVGLSSVSFQTP